MSSDEEYYIVSLYIEGDSQVEIDPECEDLRETAEEAIGSGAVGDNSVAMEVDTSPGPAKPSTTMSYSFGCRDVLLCREDGT